ncbi:phage portal protein [Paenibacillus spongiae]|uniref:Phage portal protein n=1 Tax=Paenibacillus spongiae TaxID=2909671 RepID=A0ABY5SDP4_9BACL|nr:phage portal protein [Paenibacillus spongiae]UVI32081.1 phage portal protein [Paenibacillus spongiae]
MSIFGRREQRDINGYSNEEFMRLLGINVGSVDKDKLSEITYFTCLRLLSESIAKLPLKLYREEAGKGIVKATDHYLYQKMKTRPSPFLSSFNFWSSIELNRNHFGNAYAYIEMNRGKVKWLHILPSDRVKIWLDNIGLISNENALWYIFTDQQNKEHKIHHQQILHFKTSMSLDGITGLSVQDCLKISVENAQAGQKFVNNYFKNGLFAKGLLQYTGEIEDSKRKVMQQKFESMSNGIQAAGRILPVPLGFSFSTINTDMVSSQFLELSKFTSLQIAASMGIKPNQINNMERSTHSNIEFEGLSFYIDTLLSNLTQYEQEVNFKLLGEKERERGHFWKWNVDAILRADFKTRMDGYAVAINNGFMKPNEARQKEDWPEEEDGNKLIVNGNYIPLSMVGQQYVEGGE